MASKYALRYNDSTKGKNGKPESSNMEIRITTLTAGNLVGEQTKLQTLLTAVQAVSLGLLANERITLSDTYSNAGFATDKQSQRETKWLVSMEDNVTHRVESFTIPCADLSLLPDNHDQTLDLATPASPGANLKAAIEAVWRSMNDNAGTVISVMHVGRNL